jgi:purine-binding chemotaxis protein CheW
MTDKSRRSEPQTVAEADTALINYLDTLLAEIDEHASPASGAPAVKAIEPQADMLQEGAVAASGVTDSVKSAPVGEEVRTSAPIWATSPFQVLMFSVGSVNLAVPLSALLGILPLQGELSRLPGQPRWAMGVVRNRDDKVVVVDTRRLLMPDSPASQDEDRAYSHILLIGDGHRGLAVHALNGTQILDKEAVRWRGDIDRHPWYAGIISEKLMAVIDVDGIIGMLAA